MRKTLTGLFLATFALVWSGCIFQPRDPEPPDSGVVITYLDQSSAANVLANLQKAMENRDPGGYERQIAEDFVYEPDSGTEASYPGIDWSAWDRAKEIAFMNDFLGNIDGMVVDMQAVDWNSDTVSDDELRYTYSVTVEESGGQVPYRARYTMNFRLDGTFWVLYRWFDEQGEQDPDTGANLPSLGQRRGAFEAAGGG